MVDSLSVERKPGASTELLSQQRLRVLCVSAVVLSVGHLAPTIAEPKSLMEAAFASPDASRRAEAVLAIGEYIVGDTQRYMQCLEADAEWMARAIQSYPHARAMLARVRDDQGDNAVARKVTLTIIALDNLPAPPADTLRERIFLSRSSP